MAENEEIGFSPKTQYLLLCFILFWLLIPQEKIKIIKAFPLMTNSCTDMQPCHEETENTLRSWKKKVETVQKSPDTTNSLTQKHDIIQKKVCICTPAHLHCSLIAQPQERCLWGKTIVDPPPPATNIIQPLRRKKTIQEHTNCFFMTRIIFQLNLQKPVMKKGHQDI